MDKPITEVTAELYDLLQPLSPVDRQRVLTATMALLGDAVAPLSSSAHARPTTDPEPVPKSAISDSGIEFEGLGDKAVRWMRQNRVDRLSLDQVFHIDGDVEIIQTGVPGRSRREATTNCYLLVGLKHLLADDEPSFPDQEAVELCQLADAYDKNNHSTNRNAIGNKITGNRRTGFSLTVPGLRDAAALINEMGER